MMTKVYVCEQMTCEEIIARSQRYLDIVAGASLSHKDEDDIVTMTIQNFENFFNRGWVEYRKSVSEHKDYAVLEWDGEGSIIRSLRGKEYIDCLGGYGIYNCGIKHPKIVAAVRNQLARMPLSSQELLDPLRAEMQIEAAYSKAGLVYTAHALGPRFTDPHWTPVNLTAALT